MKRRGLAKIVEEQPDFPFIVISPQCPRGEHWSGERLSVLLDEAIAQALTIQMVFAVSARAG
ncbi:MAG: hypothetical protein KME40_05735 [Komarekiella atlantica HA4396-MV6]|nr:hypothetical protein [Komarekiella atlantica HA4396-MV6]